MGKPPAKTAGRNYCAPVVTPAAWVGDNIFPLSHLFDEKKNGSTVSIFSEFTPKKADFVIKKKPIEIRVI